jgi:tetratricopeptide (TPR) repeat protein
MKCRYKICFITVLAFAVFSMAGAVAFAAVLFQDDAAAEETAAEDMTQEEYDAYTKLYDTLTAAINEEDPAKRCDMLLAFIAKYPDSEYVESNAKPTYRTALYQLSDNKKYQELGVLAEKWLERYPDDLGTIGYAATAALQLKDDEKSLKYLLKIYELTPTADGARAIAQTYDKLGNFDKYVEWCEKVFTYPEFSIDYTLRFNLVQRFLKAENLPKATEYARKTLEVIEAAPPPDAAGRKTLSTIRRNCYNIIASALYMEDKFEEAKQAYEHALKTELYQEGFYRIGLCLWKLKDEMARDYFAAAELMTGEYTEKAKEYKEQLHKESHNQTLVGIEKVHKRAQAIIDSFSNPDAQKKTELSSLN